MTVKRSSVLDNIIYINRQVPSDNKGNRLLTYSWTDLLNGGVCDVYETVYRKNIENENEFHGLFFYPKNSFIFRGIKGKSRIILVDMRPESNQYLKNNIHKIESDGAFQLQVPEGYAWGVLSDEKNVEVQIHAKTMLDTEPILVNPFDGKIQFSWNTEEFTVAKYDFPSVTIDEYEELLAKL